VQLGKPSFPSIQLSRRYFLWRLICRLSLAFPFCSGFVLLDKLLFMGSCATASYLYSSATHVCISFFCSIRFHLWHAWLPCFVEVCRKRFIPLYIVDNKESTGNSTSLLFIKPHLSSVLLPWGPFRRGPMVGLLIRGVPLLLLVSVANIYKKQ
jgi:hypothetical protein